MKFRDVILKPFRKAPRDKRPARALYMLDDGWLPLLETVLSVAREAVGNLLSEALELFPSEEEFGDVRLQRAIFELVFGYFFPIKSPVADSRQVIERRKRLFQWLHAKGLLFSPRNERKSLLLEFLKEELRIEPQELEDKDLELLLFADHDEFLQVEDCGISITPELLRSKFNWEAFRALVRNSLQITVVLITSPLGSTVRKLYFIAKKYGLSVDFRKVNENQTYIQVHGPAQLVGRAIKYGNAMASFMWVLLRECVRTNVFLSELWVEAVVNDQRKWVHVDASLLFESISQLSESLGDVLTERDVGYDSSVEEAFFIQFKRCGAFSLLERDAPVIVSENHVIIPDGIFKYRGNHVYLEIMGFWTEHYAKRKVRQLNSLPREIRNRYLVMVDEGVVVSGLVGPFLKFSGKIFPWKAIRDFLWETLEKRPFEDHLTNLMTERKEKIAEMLEVIKKLGGMCESKDLITIVSAETVTEGEHLIKALLERSKEIHDVIGWLSHSRGLVLYLKEYVKSLQLELASTVFSGVEQVSLEDVRSFLRQKGINDHFIPVVLELLPLRKKYASLTEVMVRLACN